MATYVSPVTRHVLLTGPPGIGKTTLTKKIYKFLQAQGIQVQGFYTEEVRLERKRIGFDIVTLDDQRGQLARVKDNGEYGCRTSRVYKVGQYTVDLHSFELLALPVLRIKNDSGPLVYIIDEIGKMEIFSSRFIQSVRAIFDKPGSVVLSTVPVAKGKPIPLVEELCKRADTKLVTVSKDNRDNLLKEVADQLIESMQY